MADYDKVAKYYDMFYGDVFPYEAEVSSLQRLFERKGVQTVLDVPCGTGNHLIRLARLGYQCCGGDISGGMLARAREKTAGMTIDFFTCDVKNLEIPRTFDAVISLYGLPSTLLARHPEPSLAAMRQRFHTALRGIYNVLKPGGLFVFNILNPNVPLPFPGFGPWGEFNIHTKEQDDIKILSLSTIHRRDELINFKDVYLIQDGDQLSMEMLGYCVGLLSIDQLKEDLRENGFTVEGLYGYLADLAPTGEEALDITIAAVKR